jgi:hypothetical protein
MSPISQPKQGLTSARNSAPPVYRPQISATAQAKSEVLQPIQQNIPHVQGGVIQRVLVNGVDLTKTSKFGQIRDALVWGKFTGICAKITAQQKSELIAELTGRDDCADILSDLSDFEDSSESVNDDTSWDDDDLGVLPTTSASAKPLKQEEDAPSRQQIIDKFSWDSFPSSKGNYVRIGFHETNSENVPTLVASGPSKEKFGTGRGLGKGRGFYVTPLSGAKAFKTAAGAIAYGESFVVVYVHTHLKCYGTSASTVEEADEICADDDRFKETYYAMGAGGEIVLPERCFPSVKIAATPGDV